MYFHESPYGAASQDIFVDMKISFYKNLLTFNTHLFFIYNVYGLFILPQHSFIILNSDIVLYFEETKSIDPFGGSVRCLIGQSQ